MANKHIRRCSTSQVIKELQIKTKVRYQHTPIGVVKIQKLTTPNAVKDVKQQELSFFAGGMQIVQTLWKTIWWFLTKLKIVSSCNAAIMLLDIDPIELKTYVHIKSCIQMFIAALFIIAKNWK